MNPCKWNIRDKEIIYVEIVGEVGREMRKGMFSLEQEIK